MREVVIIANNIKTLNLFANVEINNNTIIIESDINILDKSFTTLISVLNIDNKVNIIEQYDIVETDKLIFDELIIFVLAISNGSIIVGALGEPGNSNGTSFQPFNQSFLKNCAEPGFISFACW